MLSPIEFAQQHGDFFTFAMLTIDMLVTPNELHIPYDMLLEVTYEFYNQMPEFDEAQHGSPYEQKESYIGGSDAYLLALQNVSDNHGIHWVGFVPQQNN